MRARRKHGNCILCKSELSESTKAEHVLINALGGKKTTVLAICSNCNQSMGSGPDQDLADSVKCIRNLCNFKSGDGKPPPEIKNVAHDSDNESLRLNLIQGSPQIVHEHPLRDKDFWNRDLVTISADSENHFERVVADIVRSRRLPLEKAEKLTQALKANAKLQSLPSPQVTLSFNFGAGESFRSMAKSCFVLWSLKVGNKEALHPRYDVIRHFINGTQNINPSEMFVTLDLRVPPGVLEEFGTHPNIVWVGSNGAGAVLGYFWLYGMIAVKVHICSIGALKNIASGLISNPFDPNQWDDGDRVAKLINFDWLNAADGHRDLEALKRSLNGLLLTSQKRQRLEALEYEISQAISSFGFESDAILSDRQVQGIIQEVSRSVFNLIMRLPSEQAAFKTHPN